jgi:hypothetical protein
MCTEILHQRTLSTVVRGVRLNLTQNSARSASVVKGGTETTLNKTLRTVVRGVRLNLNSARSVVKGGTETST